MPPVRPGALRGDARHRPSGAQWRRRNSGTWKREGVARPRFASLDSLCRCLAAMGKRVALVLAGCGVFDGSEIHEASAALVHLSRGGAEVGGGGSRSPGPRGPVWSCAWQSVWGGVWLRRLFVPISNRGTPAFAHCLPCAAERGTPCRGSCLWDRASPASRFFFSAPQHTAMPFQQ